MLQKKSVFTIYLIGPTYTGKTYIIQKYVNHLDKYIFDYTRGIEFEYKTINLDENTKIRLNICDTSGMPYYKRFIFNPIKNRCDGIIFVYSINDKRSFDELFNDFINPIKKIIDLNSIPVYLVGNECLPGEKREIEKEEAENKLKEYEYNFKFMETCAKNNINLNELFQNIAEDMYKKYKEKEENQEINQINQINQINENNNNIIIAQNNKPKKSVLQKVSNFFKRITKHF